MHESEPSKAALATLALIGALPGGGEVMFAATPATP
jgi:hypothetical protein